MSSPNFTHVYTALLAVLNTKLPEIVSLVIKRVILQFRRAYKRNNRVIFRLLYYTIFSYFLIINI